MTSRARLKPRGTLFDQGGTQQGAWNTGAFADTSALEVEQAIDAFRQYTLLGRCRRQIAENFESTTVE